MSKHTMNWSGRPTLNCQSLMSDLQLASPIKTDERLIFSRMFIKFQFDIHLFYQKLESRDECFSCHFSLILDFLNI